MLDGAPIAGEIPQKAGALTCYTFGEGGLAMEFLVMVTLFVLGLGFFSALLPFMLSPRGKRPSR